LTIAGTKNRAAMAEINNADAARIACHVVRELRES
jgi:hypothetical protein